MSKTDKTRPWWVRATERPMHTCVPVHQHENGVCDLHDRPVEVSWFERDRCHWTYGPDFFHGRDQGCGCPGCTNQFARRLENRRDRRAGRRETRAEQADYRHGLGEEADLWR